MRKLFFLFISSALILSLSCKKESNIVNVIEYKIDDFDNYFSIIKFQDADGKTVILDDPADFPGGSEIISVNTRPFTAVLEAKVDNTTNATRNYMLSIIVDGKTMVFENLQVMPFSTATADVRYIVQ